MKGLLNHLALTLKLNFRSKQALIYGYFVPILFLLAFGSVFHNDKEPLIHELGQLLTISVLGGACFGMPTSMVSERERGVWRRYRLLPAATGGLIFSTMVARFLIVLSAAVMQIALAMIFYRMPAPQHPWQMAVAFCFVCFAFLGMGLVIAMLSETVPAVQALGQAIFLPMIMIGGVGVPLRTLPVWAQHVAAFLPGRYAVQALQACAVETERYHGLHSATFDLIALTIIGISGCLTGAKLFRWDVGQRLSQSARAWIVPALASWAVVGVIAEARGKAVVYYPPPPTPNRQIAKAQQPLPATSPSSVAGTEPSATTEPAAAAASPSDPLWKSINKKQIDSITYDDLEPDSGPVTPLLPSLDGLDDDAKKRLDLFSERLTDWQPGNVPDLAQRVRSLISVAAVADLLQDEQEAAFPYVIFDKLKFDIPQPDLVKVLAYIILNPDEGTVVTDAKELGINGEADEGQVRQRVTAYAKKFLFRLLNKGKP
ncbi:MAG TPA: ABC transporter permease [Tepidisphaeraceae bacterium]|jgi:ABC-2 type transport system permease protein